LLTVGVNRWRRRLTAPTLANVETTALFRLSGNATLTAAAVTRGLGIQPTRAFEAGDPVRSRSATTRHGSLWLLASSPRIEADTEITWHLHGLLATLEPTTAALWELARSGYDANWLCCIGSHSAELDRDTMHRILALPGDLWLDVHGDDADT
jgi:hypothetical protein